MKSALVVVLLVGCASVSREAPTDDAGSDSASVIDSEPPGVDAWMLEDTNGKCPEHEPFGPCTATVSCTYPDAVCGGDKTMKCVDGMWTHTSMSKCGPICPQSRPEPGASCSSYPSGQQCSFWPVSSDVCESCTCTAGTWVCGTSCTMKRTDCQKGTACTANTGCGAGRCSNFCGCSTDGVLHCTSTLC